MIWMTRIADRSEELLVAGRTAAVLGRAGALAGQALRGAKIGIGRFDSLNDDFVRPAVARVIEVFHLCAVDRRGLAQCQLGLVVYLILGLVWLRLTVASVTYDPFVKMSILPAHGDLEDSV